VIEKIENEIKQFSMTMGMDNMSFPDNGEAIQFAFENISDFFIEYDEDNLYLYLVDEVNEYELCDKIEKAFELCHFKETKSIDTQVAIDNDKRIVFLSCLNGSDIASIEIENVLNNLVSINEKIHI